jgi:hypothetical protein
VWGSRPLPPFQYGREYSHGCKQAKLGMVLVLVLTHTGTAVSVNATEEAKSPRTPTCSSVM